MPKPTRAAQPATTPQAAQADNKVALPSEARARMQTTLDMTIALMGGTTAMRAASVKYLPKWPKEEDKVYSTRLANSTLFPAYSRTITTLVGKPFSKPLTYDKGFDPDMLKWMEDDADLQGRHLDSFAAGCLRSAMAHGLCGILVDCPAAPAKEDGSALTQADEAAANIRPYFVKIEWSNVLGWRSEQVAGKARLTQLRFIEWVEEPDGEFGDKLVKQVKVLEPGRWRTFRETKRDQWTKHAEGTTSLTDLIPFVPVYGEYVGFMDGRPPLLEMAHLNVKHWQSQSDQDNLLHVARVPVLAIIGIDDETWTLDVGAQTAVKLPLGSGMQFVEHGGAAIGAGRLSLEDLKEEMRQSGAELLVLKPGTITATQVQTENAVGMSPLQKMAADLQDALNLALVYAGMWVRKSNVGTVKVFADFGSLSLAETSTTLLLQMYQAGALSKETLLQEVKRRGILSDEIEVKAELARIEVDGPPGGGDDGGGGGGNGQ